MPKIRPRNLNSEENRSHEVSCALATKSAHQVRRYAQRRNESAVEESTRPAHYLQARALITSTFRTARLALSRPFTTLFCRAQWVVVGSDTNT